VPTSIWHPAERYWTSMSATVDRTTAYTGALTRPEVEANISRVPYLPGLDGIRALAVVSVMIYHANSDWLKGGFLGVEVFFVISGYLITLLLISEKEQTNRVDMKHFWIRRARRLLPALFVMLFMLTIWTALFERSTLGKLRGDVIAALSYGSNWYQVYTGQGYSAANDFAPLRHLWSLAVEEQFYLILPLFLVLVFFRTRHKLALMSALFAASFAVRAWVLVRHPHLTRTSFANHFFRDFPGFTCEYFDSVYDKLPTRFGPFVVGVALAWAHRHHGSRLRRFFVHPFASDAAWMAGAAVCVAMVCVPIFRPDTAGGPALTPSFIFAYALVHRNLWAVGVGLALLATLYPQGPLGRAGAAILGARVWYPVAQLSYSTYLFHLGFVMVSYCWLPGFFTPASICGRRWPPSRFPSWGWPSRSRPRCRSPSGRSSTCWSNAPSSTCDVRPPKSVQPFGCTLAPDRL